MDTYVNEAALSKIINRIKDEMTGVVTGIEIKDEVLYFTRRAYGVPEEDGYPTIALTEWGSISREGVEEDSAEYIRTIDHILVVGKSAITISTGLGTTIRILCYDENKEFLTGWNGEYNYQHIDDGGTFSIPANAHYIKFRFSATSLTSASLVYTD